MPPWAIRKKQKTEEKGDPGPQGPQGPGPEPFIYKHLSVSMLEDYLMNYAWLLYKFDKTYTGASYDAKRQILKIENILNYVVEADISGRSPFLSNRENNETIFGKEYLIFKGFNFLSLNINPFFPNFFNIFIVYNLQRRAYDTSVDAFVNTLFYNNNSHLENNKQIKFHANGSLYIGKGEGGDGDGFVIIGPQNVRGQRPIGSYQDRVNPNVFDEWLCLSVHWNNSLSHPSSVWCNGRKLASFSILHPTRPISNTPFYIGANSDPNRLGVGLRGSIALFSFNDKLILDNDIKLHHFVFCQFWFKIRHQPILII